MYLFISGLIPALAPQQNEDDKSII